MPTESERQSNELAEISSAEMAQIQGGAWYAKFDGVDGSSASSASGGGGGAGKVHMRDFTFTMKFCKV
jgi:hypothetical protein